MNDTGNDTDKKENVNSGLDFWKDIWDKNTTPHFHKEIVHPDLVKHENLLITHQNCRVFIPLCGKTVDIIYLAADKGHEVVGLEFCEKAVKQFFDENSLSYERSQVQSFQVYKAKQQPITIFQGNFFAAASDILGTFDAVWDRGSFAALNPVNRSQYIKIISSLLKKDGKYLLNAFRYDPDKFSGPPQSMTDVEIKDMFGEVHLETKKLDEYDDFNQKRAGWGLDYFLIKNFLLSFN